MIDFQTAFNDLCNEEPWADLTVFFDKYELFEEFPLVSRYKNIATLRKEMRTDNIAEFLINTSFFILTSALLYVTKNNIPIDNRFFAITFTDFELSIPGEPPIPSFFIHPDETRNAFLKKLRVHKKHTESNEMLTVKKLFTQCRLENLFEFYESRFFDEACSEDFIRVFAVLR